MVVSTEASQGGRPRHITLHGKTYRIPTRPVVVVCVDGFDPTYLQQGIADGVIPTLAGFVKDGFHETAQCAMPSFTNPNNVSIITGQPTAVHGISGNYFLDRATGEEAMIVDDKLLRGSTILAEMAAAGLRIAAITAKDKLRRILQHGLNVAGQDKAGGLATAETSNMNICYSAEKASDETVAWLGYDARPVQYSGELSLFVLDAGVKLLTENRADIYYLTLSDFVQHNHEPGSLEANRFMAAIDARLKSLVDLGAVVAVTGDHGMSDKCSDDGKPNILFLQDALEARFGPDCGARVICPITDPFVRHHGALGSFVRVHVTPSVNGVSTTTTTLTTHEKSIADMAEFCRTLPEVLEVRLREDAAWAYETPVDYEGDFVVVSKKNAVVGSKVSDHDLSNINAHRLRSHGGLSEQEIPLLMSVPAKQTPAGKQWRNFDIFDLILNYS